MEMIKDLDSVVVLKDMPSHKLMRGDVGTVVQILDDDMYEIEFIDEFGKTTNLILLSPNNFIRLNLKFALH